jgi:hypothetical protein
MRDATRKQLSSEVDALGVASGLDPSVDPGIGFALSKDEPLG